MYKSVIIDPNGQRVSAYLGFLVYGEGGYPGHKQFLKEYTTHRPVPEGYCFSSLRRAKETLLCSMKIEVWKVSVAKSRRVFVVAPWRYHYEISHWNHSWVREADVPYFREQAAAPQHTYHCTNIVLKTLAWRNYDV
jgi:hypothetical protein